MLADGRAHDQGEQEVDNAKNEEKPGCDRSKGLYAVGGGRTPDELPRDESSEMADILGTQNTGRDPKHSCTEKPGRGVLG